MERKKASLEQLIDTAINWYEEHKDEISAATPIRTPGITYSRKFLNSMDNEILKWKSGVMPLELADCYIRRPLRKIYSYLRGKKKE